MRARWVLSKYALDGSLLEQREVQYSKEDFELDTVRDGMSRFIQQRSEAISLFEQWNSPFEHLRLTLECEWFNEEPTGEEV